MTDRNKNTQPAKPSYGVAITPDSIDVYWNVYKNLEKELIDLADVIYINDAQKGVYSIRIAELIIRTSSEIECLCKDLFMSLGVPFSRPQMRFDFDCIAEFENRWGIESKVVEITHPFFRLSQRQLYPFRNALEPTNKANPNPWKKAYNDAKHNLRNQLGSATIGTLIEEMAALYLLNVYSRYYGNPTTLPDRVAAQNFDPSFGSSLFAVKVQKTLDVKGISAEGIELHDLVWQSECTCKIEPARVSLDHIHKLMKDFADEARGYVPNVEKLVQAGRLKLPASSDYMSGISFHANLMAMNQHPGALAKAVMSMQYVASLLEKPSTQNAQP